jgi:hypothetical protein
MPLRNSSADSLPPLAQVRENKENATQREQENSRAPRFLIPVFKLPVLLYRLRLGWLLGKRFMQLTHVGRRSGKVRRTVLAVLRFDEKTREIYAVSAWKGYNGPVNLDTKIGPLKVE